MMTRTAAAIRMIKAKGIIPDMTAVVQNTNNTGITKESITGIRLPGRITTGGCITGSVGFPKNITMDQPTAMTLIILKIG
jgi:hypothetical protein